jgi:hypothetical protein
MIDYYFPHQRIGAGDIDAPKRASGAEELKTGRASRLEQLESKASSSLDPRQSGSSL